MWNDILSFLQNTGFALIANDWRVVVMLLISFFLLYLAIAKKYEPLLLLPIAFGMLLTNLPGAGLFHSELWTAFLDENSPPGKPAQQPPQRHDPGHAPGLHGDDGAGRGSGMMRG